MTPGVRVIRFARVESAPSSAPAVDGVVSRVLLDEQPAPVGFLRRNGPAWEYVLADGSLSGLRSTESRQDLEHQVVLYYFGTIATSTGPGDPPPLRVAV